MEDPSLKESNNNEPGKHLIVGHYRPASETPFKMAFRKLTEGGPILCAESQGISIEKYISNLRLTVASDPGLHCLSMSNGKNAKLNCACFLYSTLNYTSHLSQTAVVLSVNIYDHKLLSSPLESNIVLYLLGMVYIQ